MNFSETRQKIENILESNPGVVVIRRNLKTDNVLLSEGRSGGLYLRYMIVPKPGIFVPEELKEFGLDLFDGSGIKVQTPGNYDFCIHEGKFNCGVLYIESEPVVIETRESRKSFEVRDQSIVNELGLQEGFKDSLDTSKNYCSSGFSLFVYPDERWIRDKFGHGEITHSIPLKELEEYK
ncbi:hypothetical protein HOG16_02610 [Candidatus Woesearchaeota archaeon]|jgi:hypothetical protein|nr:hypothetical protein [Candidatus Woesearchaeota archaeon]MBT4321989.1 hypothetical protein [Candidatus Woesearchaeota archaeon]MBT4630735.1 hypothetical protein [Candidatus Woesearchaeota archaeon]